MIDQYRIVHRDGEITQQRRIVTLSIKGFFRPYIDYTFGEWVDVPILKTYKLRVGDRVRVNETAGFHRGCVGTINFIEPSGKVWLTRDNSDSPVYYHPDELDLEWRSPNDP